jgi:ABC-type polysaccharide/polyol phosphate export permease
MLFDASFLQTMCIPMVLHMLWNAPFQTPFELHHIALGIVGWFVVFGLVQQGLHQIREEQSALARVVVPEVTSTPGPQLVQPATAAIA